MCNEQHMSEYCKLESNHLHKQHTGRNNAKLNQTVGRTSTENEVSKLKA
jgi:hypothetical protein